MGFLNSLVGSLPVVGSLLSGFAGKNEQQAPQPYGTTSSSEAGFKTMPKELQEAYLKQYLPQILAQSTGPYNAGPMGQAATGPYAPQGLQQLQQHYNQYGSPFAGNGGAMPLGAVEPFHPYQTQAFGQIEGASNAPGLESQLRPYMDLYNKYVLSPTLERNKRERAEVENALLGRGQGNLGYFGSSALGTQRAQLEKNYGQLEQEAQAEALQNALGLRRQGLGDLLAAGGAIQEHGQQYLNALQPQMQAALPQNRTSALGQQLGLIPGASQSSTSTGYHQPEAKPNAAMRWGGALQSLGSLFQGGGPMANAFGGGQQQAMPQAGTINFQPPQPPAGFGGGYNAFGAGRNPGFNPAFGYR